MDLTFSKLTGLLHRWALESLFLSTEEDRTEGHDSNSDRAEGGIALLLDKLVQTVDQGAKVIIIMYMQTMA